MKYFLPTKPYRFILVLSLLFSGLSRFSIVRLWRLFLPLLVSCVGFALPWWILASSPINTSYSRRIRYGINEHEPSSTGYPT